MYLLKLKTLFLSALFLVFGCSVESDSILIENVTLLSMETDELSENQSILINDGRIAWVGPAADAPTFRGVTTITGEYYVMPGLAEMHAHIPSISQGEEYMEAVLGLYLSQGITTIRGMLGQATHLEMREKASAEEIKSPRIFTSGPSFGANSVSDPEQARQMVRDQKKAGYDLLKFHPGLSVELFEAITDEANAIGIEFSGHISHAVGLERSLAAGKGSIDHLDRYMEYLAGDPEDREDSPIIYFGYDLANDADENRIREAARITREAGVWNVPTNTLLVNVFSPDYSPEEMNQWPGMEFIPENTRTGWVNFVRQIRAGDDYDEVQARKFLDLRNKLTMALHEEGAGLLLGADAPQIFNPPGYSAHRELSLLVNAGLSPFEALKTGTINVGKYLDEEDLTGKIAEGYRADLILLSANPLESIPFHDRIEGVMKEGKYYHRAALDEILERVHQVMNQD